jgi:hypothetical protein
MNPFFNWASRYGWASQGFLPFFFGYERIFSFIGVRELVALLLGYERVVYFLFEFVSSSRCSSVPLVATQLPKPFILIFGVLH